MSHRIGLELYAIEAFNETRARGLDYGFLTAPHRKETVATLPAAQASKHLSFQSREITTCDVQGIRQIGHLLKIYTQRLAESNC